MSAIPIFSQAASDPLASLLERPIILGASVSADWGSPSPGRKLALRYTKPENVAAFAQGGRPGVETLRDLPEERIRGRSIVLAIDLFFWDFTHAHPRESLQALERFVAQIKKAKVPLVLGEIPELLPGRQPSRLKLNGALREACASLLEYCALMPFDELHRKVLREGGLEIGSKKYTIKELVPDGLHLSPTAGDYLADLMKEKLQTIRRKP